ncbi:hypothetical protein LMG28688_06853 [Paraburkholderia caffeinitolerans]|uniref:Uncharacterized protein n=1 Tax=Paraburkholderia caffeinitolerans TaxID=1723730 RepID=A0A6J5GZV7_9BURK|nr:hypothetical protein [Paraburkholderia caffeinitolerans]CAB3808823.1 hypothetical protein LMG28688_06853 [Paraburkholderia caffeinitolerans]
MEIDLREVQALHARYAREHFVIDLENQVKALPAPRLIAHEPAGSTSAVRRAWKARWRLGRAALMVAGGAAVCGALGMSAARLLPLMHSDRAVSHDVQGTRAMHANSSPEASSPVASPPALRSQDLLTGSGGANWSAAVDSAAALRQTAQSRETAAPGSANPAAAPDEQKALTSPPRQHVTQAPQPQESAPAAAKPAPVTTAAAAPSQSKEDQPAPRPVVRHLTHAHVSPTRTEQAANNESAKPAAAPAQRNGDVQLF